MLKGKIAVVTGGTRGIGYAVVRKYLENGAKVVLFGSREETVNKALNKLNFTTKKAIVYMCAFIFILDIILSCIKYLS